MTLHASEEEKKCGSVPMHAVEGVTFHVRSFARPSCLDTTRIRERFMGHILLKTGRTHVPRMAILARPVQLWPTTPENNGSHFFFVNCHPIVLMDDLSYVWVHGKKNVASYWLDSTRWLLQAKGIRGIY